MEVRKCSCLIWIIPNNLGVPTEDTFGWMGFRVSRRLGRGQLWHPSFVEKDMPITIEEEICDEIEDRTV